MTTPPWDFGDTPRGPTGTRVRALHHDTFVTYRPLDACPFCRAAISVEDFVAPTTELICPHTRTDDHAKLLARFADPRDGAASLQWRSETLRNGTVQVTVTWAEYDVPKATEDDPRRPPRL